MPLASLMQHSQTSERIPALECPPQGAGLVLLIFLSLGVPCSVRGLASGAQLVFLEGIITMLILSSGTVGVDRAWFESVPVLSTHVTPLAFSQQ